MNLHFEEKKLGKEISKESKNTNEWESELVNRIEFNLEKIEKMLLEKTEGLEKAISLSPQKEICSTELPLNLESVFKTLKRIESALKRHGRAEEITMKRIKDLERELNEYKLIVEEIQMERDVLLERVHSYLEMNSSLRVRLEEQRYHSGALQRCQTPHLESEVQTLRVENKRLADSNIRKDIEINKMNADLQQTTKSLEQERTESLNCKIEKNNLILILKRAFQKTLIENARLEEKCEKLMEQVLNKDYVLIKNMCESDLVKRKTNFLKKFNSTSNLDSINLPLESFHCLSFNCPTSAPLPVLRQNRQCSQRYRWKSNPELDIFQKFSSTTLIEGVYSYPVNQETKEVFDESCQRTQQRGKNSEQINSNERLCSQLNKIKHDLENLTQKLKAVKIQLIYLQLSEDTNNEMEESYMMQKIKETRANLSLKKRKADLKSLTDTLEEAKCLNAKLQNMKAEKEKISGSIFKKKFEPNF